MPMMFVRLGSTVRMPHLVEVDDLNEASAKVRAYIERHDLTAGCGHEEAFTGGEVYVGDTLIARVSYNGRVWNPDGSPAKV